MTEKPRGIARVRDTTLPVPEHKHRLYATIQSNRTLCLRTGWCQLIPNEKHEISGTTSFNEYTENQLVSHCPAAAEGTEWPYSFALRMRHGRRNGTRVRASALAQASTVGDADSRVPATRTPLISSSWWKYDDVGDTVRFPTSREPSFPFVPEAAWRFDSEVY